MREISVFFLRGLSTKGGDDIRFTFMRWGMMYTHLQRELKSHGITLYPILGMGGASFDDQAALALEYLRNHLVWSNPGTKVHLLGHSAGGLIGKRIINRLGTDGAKVGSLVTIASPHRGSRLAEMCLEAPKQHPFFVWLLRTMGYDVRRGFHFYEQLTGAAVHGTFGRWQAPIGLKTASIICEASGKHRSWPFWLAQILPNIRNIPKPSDGLLEKSSQTFGQIIGDYQLDHLCQLGVYHRPEFKRMCRDLATYYKSL